jgi:serine/threonine-protein kinase
VKYLSQLASGLDKAHAWIDRDGLPAPIVHRDLKPSNLFLTEDEDGAPLVKILDWGIAKMLSSVSTQSIDLRGTPLYMAPERFKELPITAVTDIWNLGLIAFFLLTGKHYWKAGQSPHVAWPAFSQEVSEGPRVLPSQRLVELGLDVILPSAFDDWFMHCSHAKPELRYPTAGEAVRALAEVFNPTSSELIRDRDELDRNSFSRPGEANAAQSTSTARSSIDGGIALSSLSPARVRRNLHRGALVVALLAGVTWALILVAKFEGALRRDAPPNAVRQTPADPKTLAAMAELPASSATPPAVSTAPRSAPLALRWVASAPSAILPVAPLTGEPRVSVNRPTVESKPVRSTQVPAGAARVSYPTTATSSSPSTTANPDTKASLDEKIRELQGREQTHHP